LLGKIIGENILSAKKSEIETSYSIDLQEKNGILAKKDGITKSTNLSTNKNL
jgi:hypothetical protein